MSSLVDQLFDKLKDKKWKLVTAESCTGGMIATAITDKSGSSEIFDRGYITYSNESKIQNLGVKKTDLAIHGAVSEEVAEQMARGALRKSEANVAIAVTGIAGPNGGSAKKPVGLVYVGYALKGGVAQATKHNFEGNREEIRLQTTREAIKHLLSIIKIE